MGLFAVIPAGGSGTRLWPASRAAKPKFLMPLPGPRSMLQATIDRLSPLVPAHQMLVITGGAHAASVARQLPEIPEENIVVEPSPRGTGPAISLGAALIARHAPTAVMGSFEADHHVTDPAAFHRAIRAAVPVAEEGYLVTIGITPTAPETGYGYIRVGEPIAQHQGTMVQRGLAFKEKPDRATAEAYLASGQYLWNASMFVWRVDTLLAALRTFLPEVHEILTAIAAAWDTPQREARLADLWPRLPDVTIDEGIMEHAERIAVVPGSFGWTDLGDWDALARVLTTDAAENVVINGHHIAEDTSATLVISSGRPVATLGVRNLVIVDTDDVLLVCDRTRAQEVRRIVQRLKGQGPHSLV